MNILETLTISISETYFYLAKERNRRLSSSPSLRRTTWKCNQIKKVIHNSEKSKSNLRSISPTFYVQLLHVQIPKAQKRQSSQAYFALLVSAHVKVVLKDVDEIDPWMSNSPIRLHKA